jgi:hypothetical protein
MYEDEGSSDLRPGVGRPSVDSTAADPAVTRASTGPELGDVAPIPPGAVDPVRLAHVLAEADPWLGDEDYYQPTAADEELIFLLDHPEFAEAGVLDGNHRSPEPILEPTSVPSSNPGEPADERWIPDDDDDPAEGTRWHPAARVPAHLPQLEDRPGGAELAAILADANLADLGAYELVEHVAACERVAAAMHALQAKSIAELQRREEMRPLAGARAVADPARATALEVAARLARSGAEGDALVARADYLTTTLPGTFRAWAAGEIDTEKADLIGRKLCRLDTALARRVETAVLPEAPRVTLDRLRRLIAKEIHRLDPKDADQRHRNARQGRFVRIIPTDDGMAWIEAYVSAADAAAVKAVLDAGAEALKRHDHATRTDRDPTRTGRDSNGTDGADPNDDADGGGRTMANRRADVLTSLAWAAVAAGRIGGCNRCRAGLKLADAHGRPVTVNVTVPATSLLGSDDEPAVLEGYGSITPAAARELARNAVWRRLLTDPRSGTVLDVGRTRYRPPADLAEHILLRDVTCVWPGCDRPANGPGIELDHIHAWVDGGVTAAHNLGAFCAKHHTDKHETGWLVSQPEPGRFDFTSPTGHEYTRQPAQQPARSDPEAADSTDPPPF